MVQQNLLRKIDGKVALTNGTNGDSKPVARKMSQTTLLGGWGKRLRSKSASSTLPTPSQTSGKEIGIDSAYPNSILSLFESALYLGISLYRFVRANYRTKVRKSRSGGYAHQNTTTTRCKSSSNRRVLRERRHEIRITGSRNPHEQTHEKGERMDRVVNTVSTVYRIRGTGVYAYVQILCIITSFSFLHCLALFPVLCELHCIFCIARPMVHVMHLYN